MIRISFRTLFFSSLIAFSLYISSQFFRIGINTALFPLLEVIILYYLSIYTHSPSFILLSYGVLADLMNGDKIGITSFAALASFLLFCQLQAKLKITDYIYTCVIFPVYFLMFFSCKIILMSTKNSISVNYQILLFQLIITSLCYPLIGRILHFFNKRITSEVKG